MNSGASTVQLIDSERVFNPLTDAALYGITRALASVGRAFICLDPSFTIRHVSPLLDSILGDGASKSLCGRPVEELLGVDLFGPRGPLREALLEGQMREGWRATLKFAESTPRLVSITTTHPHSEVVSLPVCTMPCRNGHLSGQEHTDRYRCSLVQL